MSLVTMDEFLVELILKCGNVEYVRRVDTRDSRQAADVVVEE